MIESRRNGRIRDLSRDLMLYLLERHDDERSDLHRKKVAEAVRHVEAVLTNTGLGIGCICNCAVIDGHTGTCPVVPFLPEGQE